MTPTIKNSLVGFVSIAILAGSMGLAAAGPVAFPAKLKLQTEKPTPIVYPECPSNFSLKQKGAHIFSCTRTTNAFSLQTVIAAAEATDCLPDDDFNAEPDVTNYIHNNTHVVRWTCRP